MARIDSGRLTIRKEPVDVAEAVLRRQVETAVATNGRAIVRSDGDPRPRIWVDKDKLAQIVANLVENAIKHGDGEVRVGVDRQRAAAPS